MPLGFVFSFGFYYNQRPLVGARKKLMQVNIALYFISFLNNFLKILKSLRTGDDKKIRKFLILFECAYNKIK